MSLNVNVENERQLTLLKERLDKKKRESFCHLMRNDKIDKSVFMLL